jgi:hypothetical protein
MLAVALTALPRAPGEAFFSGIGIDPAGNPTQFSDIVNHPNDLWTWDKSNITFKFAPSFLAAFPDPLIAQEVRLAFGEWDAAFNTPAGAIYSYDRFNGENAFAAPGIPRPAAFGDIRSIAMHEIGHTLGLGHPNQAFYFNNPQLNFRPNGIAGLAVAAPVDIEINPITHLATTQGSEVMRSGIDEYEYNHILTADELDAQRRMYNRDLNFIEVPANQPADVTITAAAYPQGSKIWGEATNFATTPRAGGPFSGVRIDSATIQFNSTKSPSLGVGTLSINWDYQNLSGKPTRSFVVRTTGTDDLVSLGQYRNLSSGHAFANYATQSGGPDAKDDVIHTFSNPANGDVPANQLLHIGLTQDVWDWRPVEARAVAPDGSSTIAPIVGFHGWSNSVLDANAQIPPGGQVQGLPVITSARGLELINASARLGLGTVALADVTGMNIPLDQLNRNLLNQLQAQNRLIFVNTGGAVLNPGDYFIMALSGTQADLPPDVINSGHFVLLNRPDLLDKELFAFADTTSLAGDAAAGSFALLNAPPIVGAFVPEPPSPVLVAAGVGALCLSLGWRKLGQNSSPSDLRD